MLHLPCEMKCARRPSQAKATRPSYRHRSPSANSLVLLCKVLAELDRCAHSLVLGRGWLVMPMLRFRNVLRRSRGMNLWSHHNSDPIPDLPKQPFDSFTAGGSPHPTSRKDRQASRPKKPPVYANKLGKNSVTACPQERAGRGAAGLPRGKLLLRRARNS